MTKNMSEIIKEYKEWRKISTPRVLLPTNWPQSLPSQPRIMPKIGPSSPWTSAPIQPTQEQKEKKFMVLCRDLLENDEDKCAFCRFRFKCYSEE